MEIRKPMELAGLKSRLARAKKTEADIADTGKRFDKVLDDIDASHAAAKSHVGDLEQYSGDLKKTVEGMIAGSNGPPDDEEEKDHKDPPVEVTAEKGEETREHGAINGLGGPRILR